MEPTNRPQATPAQYAAVAAHNSAAVTRLAAITGFDLLATLARGNREERETCRK